MCVCVLINVHYNLLLYSTVDEYCTEGKALWSVSDDGQLRIFDIRNKLMVRGRMRREHNSCTYVV